MITFKNLCQEIPYLKIKEKYDEAVKSNQKIVEAISISSFSYDANEVNSRYVNLKFIENNEFIFFSNYNSPKSNDFDTKGDSHTQPVKAIHNQRVSKVKQTKPLPRELIYPKNICFLHN